MYSIVSIMQVQSVRPLASPQYTQPSQLKPECSRDIAICPVKVHYILPSQLKPEWLYLVRVNQAAYMQILKLWSILSMHTYNYTTAFMTLSLNLCSLVPDFTHAHYCCLLYSVSHISIAFHTLQFFQQYACHS